MLVAGIDTPEAWPLFWPEQTEPPASHWRSCDLPESVLLDGQGRAAPC